MSKSASSKKVFVKKPKSVRLVPKGQAPRGSQSVEVPPAPTSDRESLFEFFCPYCGHKIPTRKSKQGSQITCSVCDESVTVPNPSEHEIEAAEPPEQGFKFDCLGCGQHLSAKMTDCGKTTICPTCDEKIEIPSEATEEKRFDLETAELVAFMYYCPHCGRRHSAIDEWIGDTIECSGCEHPIEIPSRLDA